MNYFYDLVQMSTAQVYVFLLVLARIGGIFLFDPLYGSRSIPVQLKIAFSVIFALVVMPVVQSRVAVPEGLLAFGLAVARELFVGAVIGFVVALAFAAVQFAGQMMGFSMGLAIANVVDPSSGDQVTVVARFKFILAVLIFLAINGHHWVVEAVARSYDIGAGVMVRYPEGFVGHVVALGAGLFVTAVKISAPVVVTIIVLNAALGILARTMPQMNIFIVGFPLQIGVGLITMALSMFVFAYVVRYMFEGMRTDMYVLLQYLTGA